MPSFLIDFFGYFISHSVKMTGRSTMACKPVQNSDPWHMNLSTDSAVLKQENQPKNIAVVTYYLLASFT